MLAHDVGVYVSGIHLQVFAQKITQARRVQGSAASQHPPWVEPGQHAGDPGHDVHRVGCHQEYPVKARGGHRIDDGAEHLGVALQQVQTGFPRLLGHPGADHHDVRIRAVAVLPRVDRHAGVGEGQAVVQVHGFPDRPGLVHVDQHQLVADRLVQQAVGVAHPYHPGANDYHFPLIYSHSSTHFPRKRF